MVHSSPDRGQRPALLAAAAATLLAAALVAGCGGDSVDARVNSSPPEKVIFVYDRSGSMPNYQLDLARELTDQRVSELDHGDRIVAMQLLEASLSEPPERWTQRVPLREFPDERVSSDSVARQRFLRDARDYMQSYTDTVDRETIGGTDVLSTIHDVAADLRAHPDHRTTLYLFSDMLQANQELNFERPGATPPESWVDSAAKEGTLPDLEGLCVMVVGARVDTDAGQAVRSFWERYFEATGARLESRNYVLRPVRLPPDPCARNRTSERRTESR